MSNATTPSNSTDIPPTSSIPSSSEPSSSPSPSPPPPTTSSSPPPPTTTAPTTPPSPTTTPPPTTSSIPPSTTSSVPPTSSPTPVVPPTVTTNTTVTLTPTGTPPGTTVFTTVNQTPSTTSNTPSRSPTATPIGSNGNSASHGLGASGTIAIAVVIPVVVVALLLVLGFFFWRKRKARKEAEEQRKDEMAEYGFNPNNDPTLFPVGGAAAYNDGRSDAADDNSGYRGWGTTNSNARKASTTLGSNSRAGLGGATYSDNASQPSGYAYNSPTNGAPESHPSDPLMNNHEHADEVGALGGAAAVGQRKNSQAEIHRGVSNASSSYSRAPPGSEVSAEDSYTGQPYQEDMPYTAYHEGSNSHSPYGDGTYSSNNNNNNNNNQPIIRDVSARRNTRIERAPTFPQTQGGISQNF